MEEAEIRVYRKMLLQNLRSLKVGDRVQVAGTIV